MKYIYCIIFLCVCPSCIWGQGFTDKYKVLNEENLESFFADWCNWSKEYNRKKEKDSLFVLNEKILKYIIRKYECEKETEKKRLTSELNRLEHSLSKVSNAKIDSIKKELDYLEKENAATEYLCCPDSIPIFVYSQPFELKEKSRQEVKQKHYCKVYILKKYKKTLILTDRIQRLLEDFCGGVSRFDTKNMSYLPVKPRNEKAVKAIKKFIPVYFKPNGWSFISCPYIYAILIYPNIKRFYVSKTVDTTYELSVPHGKFHEHRIVISLDEIWD
ncbi:hypothetical protein [Prevotella dentasini]|uniref:hypothetical protein n=1 Tax=Prevotella dentasini TaxID=589537 RepID=UPI00046990FE|nr:hypothetical protein [Prevotella dentasini]